MKKTTIELLDHEITVELVPRNKMPEGGMGKCNLGQSYIQLNETMTLDAQQSTFWHELLHLSADLNSIELSEQDIDGLALAMHSFVKNNPEMIKNLQRMS